MNNMNIYIIIIIYIFLLFCPKIENHQSLNPFEEHQIRFSISSLNDTRIPFSLSLNKALLQ